MIPLTSSLIRFLRGVAALGLSLVVGCGSSSSSTTNLIDAGAADAATARPSQADTEAVDAGVDDASSSGVDVTVNATIGGKPFYAAGAAATHFSFVADDGGPGAGGMALMIGQYPAMCSVPRVSFSPVLYFYLRAANQHVEPGSYPIVDDVVLGGTGAGPQATLHVLAPYGDDCGVRYEDHATSGTLVVTHRSAEVVEGTFDATLARNGHVQGTFHIVECARSSTADDGTVKCAHCKDRQGLPMRGRDGCEEGRSSGLTVAFVSDRPELHAP